MASVTSLPVLLTSLTAALASATESLPTASSILPPSDGISLLDMKNEVLLSYLQNLVFLILLKIRSETQQSKSSQHGINGLGTRAEDEDRSVRLDVVKKLVGLRVYLEKGVRPLEGKLRYQIEKLVSAADAVTKAPTRTKASTTNGARKHKYQEEKKHENDDDEEKEEEEEGEEGEESTDPSPLMPSDLSHRPNPSAFARPPKPPQQPQLKTHSKPPAPTSEGPYKPPHIAPTSLPPLNPKSSASSRPRKSHTVSNFITEELSSAPLAEPSIGALNSGLRGKEKERAEERKQYEEMRLVRLPEERGGKGRGKRRRENGDGRAELDVGDIGGGGELEGVDFGGGKRRRRDGGGGGGGEIGEAWGKRVKRGVGRKEGGKGKGKGKR